MCLLVLTSNEVVKDRKSLSFSLSLYARSNTETTVLKMFELGTVNGTTLSCPSITVVSPVERSGRLKKLY